VIKTIVANEGPRLKRYRPRAYGRAGEILKRTTHVSVVLDGKSTGKPVVKTPEAPPDKLDLTTVKKSTTTKTTPVKSTTKKVDPEVKVKDRAGRDQIIARKGKS
jgi:large subunit ribosomal protein L22